MYVHYMNPLPIRTWKRNANQTLVSLIPGFPVAGYLLLQGKMGWHSLRHTLLEYVEFMVLPGSLYTISGGIVLRGDLQVTLVVRGPCPPVSTTPRLRVRAL